MKKEKLTLLSSAALAAGAFLLLAPNTSAAETKENPNSDNVALKTKQTAADAETKSKLNADDTLFIQKEAAAGAALVKIAELGVKKSERADIKAFAGMLVTDHTKANADLTKLAATKGVELQSEVDPKVTETHEKLEAESGANFDKEFLAVIVSSHKDCIKNFENAAEDAEDAEVKSWATTMLPALQAHLKEAKKLGSASAVKSEKEATTNNTKESDNTARNMRDRDGKTLTPLDQGNNKTDTDTTAQIRKEIMGLDNISINAQNVKIITNEGHVTLRGPVKNEEEKRLIGEIANRLVTSDRTDNQLEVNAD